MIGTAAELRKRLGNIGHVSAGAQVDDSLLEDFLKAATSRLQEEIPDRTLEPWPELEVDPLAPGELVDTAAPVALVKPARRRVRVPDLRELVELRALTSSDDVRDPAVGTVIDPAAVVLESPSYRADWPAIWLELAQGRPIGYTRLRITGRFGPAESATLEPKDSVRNAALNWAARAYHARAARYSDTSATPDGGVMSYFRQLPPDVMATVNALAIPGL